ncbi:MAG: hypothetical protein WBM17_04860 [Anaerolineales bacterium]
MSDQRKTREGKADADLDFRDTPAEKANFFSDAWWEERSLPQKILAGIGFAILGIGFLALFGWIVMLLWNWLMPEIFGLPRVDYWKAWGLLALCWILFKNWSFSETSSSTSSDRKRKKQLRRYMREGESPAGEDSAAS